MSANSTDGHKHGSWLSRIGWLLLIWACSVVSLAAAAWLMRLLMRAVGLAA